MTADDEYEYELLKTIIIIIYLFYLLVLQKKTQQEYKWWLCSRLEIFWRRFCRLCSFSFFYLN